MLIALRWNGMDLQGLYHFDQMNTQFNLLDVLRTKVRNVKSMVPLTEKFLRSSGFIKTLRLIIYLSYGKTRGLATRAKYVNQFLDFVWKIQTNHGSTFTIKWLKASYVALQKELGQDRLRSLRILDPEIPLPRLNNGLPRGIPVPDRVLIRKGDVSTIRFWSSLFNLYRILIAEPKLKLETITNPLSVPEDNITRYIDICRAEGFNFFARLKGHKQWAGKDLSPHKLELSRTASPASKTAAFGVLTDIHSLVTYRPDLWETLHHFAYATNPTQTPFMEFLAEGYDIITEIAKYDCKDVQGKSGRLYFQSDTYQVKPSVRAHGAPTETFCLGQFAIKEEAAGKIRLFALMDSITQTFMRPLHDALFEVLRSIPNDGTFDQDASVRRSMSKAQRAGMAFSYDLTAATDRLPSLLSAEVLNAIFSNRYLGGYWHKIMTDRNFGFTEKVAQNLKVSDGPYRYAVGQPMGGLSSWAALAVTHHWILQLAASRALGSRTWYEDYEILGDDLVIFNKAVADEYLVIMAELGCEINLSKSIQSPNRPVFEFAKRTCWGDNIVSGFSMAQLGAGWNVGSRVGNALAFSRFGLITCPSVLLAILSKFASKRVSELKTQTTQLGLLSLLGSLYQDGKVSLEELVTAIVNPQMGIDFADQAVGLPAKAVLEVATLRMKEMNSSVRPEPGNIPWSRPAERLDFFYEHQEFLTVKTLSDNVSIAQDFLAKWKSWVLWAAEQLIFPLIPKEVNGTDLPRLQSYLDDLPSDYQEQIYRLTEWWGAALGVGSSTDDPAELLEEAMDMLEQFQYDQMLTLEEAMAFQDQLTRFEQALNYSEPVERTEITESTPILGYIRALVGKVRFKETGGIGS